MAPSAIWIWDKSGGVTSSCNKSIRVIHNFSITCLNEPISMHIAADNLFNASLNGVTGTGNVWNVTYNISVPTTFT